MPVRERLPVPAPKVTIGRCDGATHAWVEAYLPTLGWVGFDPTNDVLAADGTSASRSGAITPTCRPRAACSGVKRAASSRCS